MWVTLLHLVNYTGNKEKIQCQVPTVMVSFPIFWTVQQTLLCGTFTTLQFDLTDAALWMDINVTKNKSENFSV